jgi:hypothetical protein
MHMVCANVAGPQLPSPNSAYLFDGFFHCRSATSVEVDRRTILSTLVVLQPTAIGRDQW